MARSAGAGAGSPVARRSGRLTRLHLDSTFRDMAEHPYDEPEVVMVGRRRVTFTASVEIPVDAGETLLAHRWVAAAVVEPGVTRQPYDMVLGYGPTGWDARVDAETQARRLIRPE